MGVFFLFISFLQKPIYPFDSSFFLAPYTNLIIMLSHNILMSVKVLPYYLIHFFSFKFLDQVLRIFFAFSINFITISLAVTFLK